jgi:hypothetical protein
MLTAALTAMAMAAAVMGVIVGMIVAMAMLVQMLMLMGMDMIVGMGMVVGMGMGNTVVGVLMGMGVVMFMVVAAAGDVIVMNMHMVSPLRFFFYYTCGTRFCQNIYFCGNIPPLGLRNGRKGSIMKQKIAIYLTYERRYGNVPRAYA